LNQAKGNAQNEEDEEMNYYEVLYSNCFGDKKAILIATPQSAPTISDWNGCSLVDYHKTDQFSYSHNVLRFYQ
jgi:hypothetical protein